jgi:hypothetical protein
MVHALLDEYRAPASSEERLLHCTLDVASPVDARIAEDDTN